MNDDRNLRSEQTGPSDALDRARRELAAREAELRCMYQVSRTLSDPRRALDDKIRHVVELVASPARPAIACARILLGGRAFATEHFSQTPFRWSREIVVEGAQVGVVEVFYLAEAEHGAGDPIDAWEQLLIDAIAQAVGEHVTRARTEHRLGERIKELNCLYQVSELTHGESPVLDDVLPEILERIPPAWQYPEITCVRVTVEGRTFVTEGFRETPFRQAQAVFVDGARIGAIEVYYLEERPPSDEGPFLEDERHLLKVLAERIGDFIRRCRAEETQAQRSLELQAYTRELEQQLRVVQEQNDLIGRQKDVILELSTPVIEIWDDVLTLPIIGAVDARRAAEVMDRLLDAIAGRGARFVLLDVTGVDVVDTQVATHLIKLVEAARLLGASCVLTGLRPAVARTLVQLDVDLSAMRTRRNLRDGLRECLQSMGYEMHQKPRA